MQRVMNIFTVSTNRASTKYGVISSLLAKLVNEELYLWDHYTDTMQVQHGENMNTNANICIL